MFGDESEVTDIININRLIINQLKVNNSLQILLSNEQ